MTRKSGLSSLAALLSVALPAVMIARAGRSQSPQANSADKKANSDS